MSRMKPAASISGTRESMSTQAEIARHSHCATCTRTRAREVVRNAVAALDLDSFLELFKQVGPLASSFG